MTARRKKKHARHSHANPPRPINWRLIYVLLAAFALFTVSVSLYLNYLVGGGILLMVLVAAYYGRQIARRMARDARQRDHSVAWLRYAEARTRKILDTAGDGIITVDGKGIVKSFNRAAARIFGYKPAEIVGGKLSMLITVPQRPGRSDAIASMVGTGEAKIIGVRGEVAGRRKDGTTFPVEPAVSKIRLGRMARYIYVVRDLTERRRAEEALRRARDELETRVQERTAQLAEANRSLQEEIATRKRAQESLVQLSRRLLQTQEAERRHLARELHDEIGQTLTAIKMNLQAARRTADAEASPRLEESIGIVERTIAQVRNLSLDLRPSMLDDLGLVAALRWYVDRQAQRAGFTAHLDADANAPRLPQEVETACFRIVQEALTNIVRHAQAKQVDVKLWQGADGLHLVVHDDGTGFDLAAVRQRAARGASLGLLGMQERLELVGGSLEIQTAPAQGTEIRVRVPVPKTSPAKEREEG
jgi:PAS domain S-box-containing protein